MPYGPAAKKQRQRQHEMEAADVIQMWTRGLRFEQMLSILEDKYGKPFSLSTVQRRFKLGRDNIVIPETLQAVKEHLEKLAFLWECAQPGLRKGQPSAIQHATGILDREAKLLGLDRPVKAEIAVEVTVTGPIENELETLAKELAINDFQTVDAIEALEA